MKAILWRLRDELGVSGILSLAVLIAAGVFYFTLVQPMQAKDGELRAQLAKQARTATSAEPSSAVKSSGQGSDRRCTVSRAAASSSGEALRAEVGLPPRSRRAWASTIWFLVFM